MRHWMLAVMLVAACGGEEPQGAAVEQEVGEAAFMQWCLTNCGRGDECRAWDMEDASTWRCICEWAGIYPSGLRCDAGAACTNVSDDNANCGRCGAICPEGRWCLDGECLLEGRDTCEAERETCRL